MQAIVLAGGFGTRLQGIVSDVPKPMASVAGKPFLLYIMNYLKANDIQKVVLSVGYLNEVIIDYFKYSYKDLEIKYSIENEPLGTGGGIKKALNYTDDNEVVIINGDTYYDVPIRQLRNMHKSKDAFLTIALKPMQNVDRYGSVEINPDNRIKKFIEKNFFAQGLINGGIYFLNKNRFNQIELPDIFSFEKDFLEKYYMHDFYGFISDGFFIDIGIPDDYKRAQHEFETIKNR